MKEKNKKKKDYQRYGFYLAWNEASYVASGYQFLPHFLSSFSYLVYYCCYCCVFISCIISYGFFFPL